MNFPAITESILRQVVATFGEKTPVTYTPATGSPYATSTTGAPLSGVFDERYESVDPNSHTGISTTQPVLLVRLSDLQAVPVKGDQVTIRTSRVFTIIRMQPDGRGGALLFLHKA